MVVYFLDCRALEAHPRGMIDEIKSRVAAAVRAGRTKREISQAALAEEVGLSMEAISHIERGTSLPSLETFSALAKALDLDVGKLLVGSNRKKPLGLARARLETEVSAFADSLTDREVAKWLQFGRVMKQK